MLQIERECPLLGSSIDELRDVDWRSAFSGLTVPYCPKTSRSFLIPRDNRQNLTPKCSRCQLMNVMMLRNGTQSPLCLDRK